MIVQDWEEASRRKFDLVVVGGGIYGASLLHEAARRGLSACLCEAGDFGGGTSWNTLRIIHGGLRYLQAMDLTLFRQSVAARRHLARQFPRLIRPLECVMPLYRQGLRRRSVMRLALVINDLLSADRNRGLSDTARLPDGRVLDADAALARSPIIRREELEGAACWSDYFMVSSERILIELLRDAGRRGAIALNYAPALDLVTEGNMATGVRVRNARTDEIHVLQAKAIVNCAGPHVHALAGNRGGDANRLFRPSLAFNVLLDVTLPSQYALGLSPPGPNAPMLFLIPQQGTLLAGTMHLSRPRETTTAKPTEAEVEFFLHLLREAVPELPVNRTNVRRVFAGLLPATEVGGTRLRRREVIVDHGRAGGVQRVYSVSGVKFTTASRVARKTLTLMGYSPVTDEDGPALPLSPATTLATDAGSLWTLEDQTVRSALRTIIQEEAVCSLDDLVLRRTNWATTEADLEIVRARVKQLVDLPSDISTRHTPAATSALSDSF